MQPHARKTNEALYKLRRFKTIGAILAVEPLSSFFERLKRRLKKSKHWNGKHNVSNKLNYRPSKAKRTEGRFLKLNATKKQYGLA